MFKASMNFKVKEDKKIIIKHHKQWMFRSGYDEWIWINSAYNIKNLLYNNKWQLINRHPIKYFNTGLPDNWTAVSWVWYSKWVWDYLCVKGSSVYKADSLWGTWTSVSASFTWVDDEAYTDIIDFYTLSSSATLTSTTTAVDERYIDSTLALTVNAHVWRYIWVWSQVRLITSNTATRIFIDEKFSTIPGISVSYSIYEKIPGIFCIAEGPLMKVRDGTTFWNPRPSWSYEVYRWTKEHNRLFIIDPTNKYRLKYSILWVWSDFPALNYIDVEFEVVAIKNIKWRVILYWLNNRAELLWDTPDTFYISNSATHKWALSWGSISNWSNVQFFLSSEWIELLNAIDNASATEGVSVSDKIKDFILDASILWLSYTNFEKAKKRAHWTASGGRYYLNIWWLVIIYDFENSTLLSSHLFTTAQYTEASQYTDTGFNIAWEWTCCRDINWVLIFWQWWFLHYVEETPNYDLYSFTATLESDRLNLWDNNRPKKIRRIKQNWRSCERETEFKIYTSIDWGAYELVMTTNDFEYEIFLSKLWEDIRIKTVITQTGAGDMEYEHLRTVVYIEPQYMY